MERATWTDERLDDLARRVNRDIRDLRGEMRGEFAGVRGEIGGLRGEVDALRSMVFRVGAGIIASVITAALLHGI